MGETLVQRCCSLIDKAAFMDFTIEVVRGANWIKRICRAAPPRVIERTYGWLIRWRRLVRDNEQRINVSQNMIYVAMDSMLLDKIFPPELLNSL
jgi:putative transposase